MSEGSPGSPMQATLRLLEQRAPIIAALVALVAAFMTMTADPVGVFNDDGIYLLTAKALAEGQGYVYPELPGTPAAIHYPPIWPMLLAMLWKIAPAFPANIGWFKFVNPLLLSCAAGMVVVVGRRLFGLPWWVAFGGTIAATVSVPTLMLTNVLLSETLFLFALLPSLLVTEQLVREGGVRRAFAAALLVGLLILVRTLGGVVLIAGVMLLARERRWRELAVFAVVSVLIVLPWQQYVWAAAPGFPDELRGSYGPYLEWVVDGYKVGGVAFLRAVVTKNIDYTWLMTGVFTSPLLHGVLRHVMASLAALCFVGGMLALAGRQRAPVTALALSGYFSVVVAWPFWVDRFLWVVWPLVVLIALTGAATAVSTLRERGQPRAAYAVIGVVVLLALGHETYNLRGIAVGWSASTSRAMTAVGVRIVRQVNLDRSLDGQVIASELAPMVALYSGLQVVPLEIMTPQQFIVEKSVEERAREIERIDRRFRPAVYVVMRDGPFYAAVKAAALDSSRTVVDVSPPDNLVRTLKVMRP